MSDLLPFRKPEYRARLTLPNSDGRKEMLDVMLDCAARIEADPDFCGFALVGLMADGKRISHWAATNNSVPHLMKQVRREAALMAKESNTERSDV